MTAFYICIILIGILMMGVAVIWMVIERKNARDYRLELDERRYELQQVIEDADQLLNELNQFSNYIVTRMEEKQEDVQAVLESADERLDLFEQIKDPLFDMHGQREKKRPESEEPTVKEERHEKVSMNKGKVIPLNVKKREVLKLHEKGMDNTEIAKLLNLGKGEIDLISRMCK